MASEVKEEVENYCETDVHIEKDAWGIWKNMQQHHNHLSLEKRYLLGLCTHDSLYQNVGSNIGNQHWFNFLRFYVWRSALPESLLQKDDLFYDDVKILVERCFGGSNVDTQQCMPPVDVQFSGLHNTTKTLLTFVDDFSNMGLYYLAKIC